MANPDNTYSRLRLARYATGDERGCGIAPRVADPRVATVRDGDLAEGHLNGAGQRLVADPNQDSLPDDETLRQLGELAFFNYPVQLVPLRKLNGDAAARYGLWVDAGQASAAWFTRKWPMGRGGSNSPAPRVTLTRSAVSS